VSGASDYEHEMFRHFDLDDGTTEAIVSGRDPGRADVAMLVAFVEDARSLTRRPVPAPSAPLAAILAEGLSTEKSSVLVTAGSNGSGPANEAAGPPTRRKRRTAVAQLLSGLSVGAKAALGIGVAAAAVTGAGAAGALPGPAQHAIAAALNTVTPFGFPDNATTHADNANTHADNANTHADFGKTVSSDATGTSDGQPGVDGQSVASTAAENGLSAARETPAGDHVPPTVPPDANGSNAATDQESTNTDESTQSSSNSSNPPANAGSQSSNGIDTASSTPAQDHVPTEVPPPHPQDSGSLRSPGRAPQAVAPPNS
jgi:hypothetical protein